MKKLLFILLCLFLTVTSYASLADIYSYEYNDLGITIEFEENSHFSFDERQYIADILAYGKDSTDNSTTYAWCWLTGHDYVYESVSSIEHKVSPDAPRCYRTTYRVETCNNCDHMEYTEISKAFIDCCPED